MSEDPEWLRAVTREADILYRRVLEQAAEAGIQVPAYVKSGIPKEWMKTMYFDTVRKALLDKDPKDVMTKLKTASEYIDGVLAPRSGWIQRKDAPDRVKQQAMMGITRKPAFTPQAKNHSLPQLMETFKRMHKAVDSADWNGDPLKAEALPEFDSFGVHGYDSSLFLVGHANCIAGVDVMPWTPRDANGSPQVMYLPDSYYKKAMSDMREEILEAGSYLRPSHFLVGSPSAGGLYGDGLGVINVNNSEGAAGWRWTGLDNARELTSDGGRATKSNVTQTEIGYLVEHVLAGQPWTGPTMKNLMQPTTMTTRGDAKTHIDCVLFTTALLEAGYPLAHLMTSGRGIAITSTISWLMESVIGGPWTEALDAFDVPSFDLRGRRLVKERVRECFQKHDAGTHTTVSGDISRWDLNAAPGEHGLMAAYWANLLPPGKIPLLFGAASRPALWSAEQVKLLQGQIPVGSSKLVDVRVPEEDSMQPRVEKVEVWHLEVDVRRMVLQAFQAVHGSGVKLYGYTLPTTKTRVKVPIPNWMLEFGDSSPKGEEHFIWSHGSIRSGSLLTSANNSSLNKACLGAGYEALRRLGPRSTLVRKRVKLAGLPMPTGFNLPADGVDGFFRGDDALITFLRSVKISYSNGVYDVGQVYALIMAMTGRYGNYAKQLHGTLEEPLYEFASVLYSRQKQGGITPLQRSFERFITTEGSTSAGERLPLDDVEADAIADPAFGLDLGLITDTLSAKMRLLPQAGSQRPLSAFGNPTPGVDQVIRLAAFLDKNGLVYDLGGLTPGQYRLVQEAQAKRYALREARKGGTSKESMQDLETEYIEADLNSMLVEYANQRQGKQMPGRRTDAALRSFLGAVAEAKRGGTPYLFG